MAAMAQAQITVFAAASTKTALDEAAAAYQSATARTVTISYAGSPALARQIQLGAPADVFLSANPGWMDVLQQEGLVDPASRLDLLTNRLVLIAHGNGAAPLDLSAADLGGLLGEGRLAMALTDAVPAGIYGKAALMALGQWTAVAPKVAQAANVRAALALVASGEAPMGVVYATDARADSKVSVIAVFPEASHPRIVYPAAAVAGGNAAEAKVFLEYLRSPEARDIFLRHGFGVLAE
ncbi:molybdate ABC transporter substrate-binding protein (plasmid) [Leisingera aquaemixtae]|uniref:Molybdate ABC transporter substrate-binding protein n=1 Tax=Leisingera aquaemixtae TaxID=1396826 RepID=A0ABY5WQ74_9RHOB|nr:molybdate ABC transporter substrate-binding protein [Leisingera aquaemixtae]UWQ43633.1 molybdate ABC transporter substrate-binding protein [Leisingera aquaemixtae]